MNLRRWLVVGLLVVILLGCGGGGVMTPSGGVPVTDVAGTYSFRGQGSGGESYSGTLTIERDKDVYLVTWTFSDGSQFTGVGLLDGDVFSVAWDAGGQPGLAVYRVSGDTLSGRWTVTGETTAWTETATRKR